MNFGKLLGFGSGAVAILLGGLYFGKGVFFQKPNAVSPSAANDFSLQAPSCGEASQSCETADNATTAIGTFSAGTVSAAPKTLGQSGVLSAKVRRARELIHDSRKEAAISLLEEVLKESPNHVGALVELAMLLEKDAAQRGRAESLYERAISEDPKSLFALEEYARMKNEDGEASGALLALAQKYPDSSSVALVYGKVLLEEGNPKAAIPYLERARQTGQSPEEAYFPLAEAYRQTGDTKRAVEYQAKVVQAQEKFNQQHQRVESLQEAMSNELFDQQLNLAKTLVKNGDKEKAIPLLEVLRKERPKDPQLVRLIEILQMH